MGNTDSSEPRSYYLPQVNNVDPDGTGRREQLTDRQLEQLWREKAHHQEHKFINSNGREMQMKQMGSRQERQEMLAEQERRQRAMRQYQERQQHVRRSGTGKSGRKQILDRDDEARVQKVKMYKVADIIEVENQIPEKEYLDNFSTVNNPSCCIFEIVQKDDQGNITELVIEKNGKQVNVSKKTNVNQSDLFSHGGHGWSTSQARPDSTSSNPFDIQGLVFKQMCPDTMVGGNPNASSGNAVASGVPVPSLFGGPLGDAIGEGMHVSVDTEKTETIIGINADEQKAKKDKKKSKKDKVAKEKKPKKEKKSKKKKDDSETDTSVETNSDSSEESKKKKRTKKEPKPKKEKKVKPKKEKKSKKADAATAAGGRPGNRDDSDDSDYDTDDQDPKFQALLEPDRDSSDSEDSSDSDDSDNGQTVMNSDLEPLRDFNRDLDEFSSDDTDGSSEEDSEISDIRNDFVVDKNSQYRNGEDAAGGRAFVNNPKFR